MKATKPKPRSMAGDIVDALTAASRKWTRTKKAEERAPRSIRYRRERMIRERRMPQKEAAAQVMVEAYMKASANGTLPATARQVMYAARNQIQELTGKRLDDQYFTQTLLPDYIEEHGLSWNVVYDARGHFSEPHGDVETVVPLGTLEVRHYLNDLGPLELAEADLTDAAILPHGPDGNYAAVLFIEKEGFLPLFKQVDLADRFDLAIMSTKGVSVTAARTLIERLCGGRDLPLLVLHDFDVAGFTILRTLTHDTRRFRFSYVIEPVDLGLRLADVEDMGLEAEDAAPTKSSDAVIRERVMEAGATEEEADFLVARRVELNAMTSDQFVAFIEAKLEEHDIGKIIPEEKRLSDTYRLFERSLRLKKAFAKTKKSLAAVEVSVPPDFAKQVEDILEEEPALRWDAAVKRILEPPKAEKPKAGKIGAKPKKPARKPAGRPRKAARKRK